MVVSTFIEDLNNHTNTKIKKANIVYKNGINLVSLEEKN